MAYGSSLIYISWQLQTTRQAYSAEFSDGLVHTEKFERLVGRLRGLSGGGGGSGGSGGLGGSGAGLGRRGARLGRRG